MQFIKLPTYITKHMPIMRDGELRAVIAVAEATSMDEWAPLSWADFIDATGLSRPTLQLSIEEALEHGFIERRPHRNSYEYRLSEPEDDIYVIEREKSTRSKTTKKRKRKPARPKQEIEREKQQKEERKKFHVPLCRLFHGHKELEQLGKERVDIFTAAKFLQQHEYTLIDLADWEEHVWANDWRSKGDGRPTLKILRETMAVVRVEQKQKEEFAPLESRQGAEK